MFLTKKNSQPQVNLSVPVNQIPLDNDMDSNNTFVPQKVSNNPPALNEISMGTSILDMTGFKIPIL